MHASGNVYGELLALLQPFSSQMLLSFGCTDFALLLYIRGTLCRDTAIRDVYNWRVKETERMKAIVAELTKLGATVEEGRDYCIITAPPEGKINEGVEIETYDDHRMAMAFALAACSGTAVTILDPGCTRKTFPKYFDVLESVTVR
jgi:5-enolpyruvylshikimate-3-phosphate synthase